MTVEPKLCSGVLPKLETGACVDELPNIDCPGLACACWANGEVAEALEPKLPKVGDLFWLPKLRNGEVAEAPPNGFAGFAGSALGWILEGFDAHGD